jgi:nesprin-1
MHSKLQVEKTRLSLAIQACEAATACISRPNTPQDPIPHRVPESELNARSKLEDFLDQVPSVVCSICVDCPLSMV